jgi:hypothetical protein
VDRHFQAAFLIGEMRDQTGQFLDFLVGRERQDETGAADRLQFDDFCDFDLAYIPVHPAFSLSGFIAAKMLVFVLRRNGSNPRHPALSE